MKPSEADFALQAIKDRLASVLVPDASRVLEEARSQFVAARDLFQATKASKRSKLPDWGFSISREDPLIFRDCLVRKYRVRVDLFCTFQWPGDASLPARSHTLGMRVWCLDRRLCFRHNWDAQTIEHSLGDPCRRVMFRCHFDFANAGQSGPKYHVQFGGDPHTAELYWVPPAMNLPRIIHPPTDIVLACQLITANFFPDEYSKVKKEATWISAVRTSQNRFLQPYFDHCNDSLRNNEMLLDALWNPAA
jgi:hypothetical protein